MSFHDDRECKMVADFHARFGQLINYTPGHLTRRKLYERVVSMAEEVAEFAEHCGMKVTLTIERADGAAGDDQDLAGQADALIDLVYFAKGTAVMLGLPWASLFDDVQRANMAKVAGVTKRGFLMDVTKPPGWVGPRTEDLLAAAGYRRELWLTEGGAVDESKCADDPIHKAAAPAEGGAP